jgi:hypothetical protein
MVRRTLRDVVEEAPLRIVPERLRSRIDAVAAGSRAA